MENNNTKKQIRRDNAEYRNLTTNSLFSFLNNYSSLFFTFCISLAMTIFLKAYMFKDASLIFFQNLG